MSTPRSYVEIAAVRALISAETERHRTERKKHSPGSWRYDMEAGADDALFALHMKIIDLDVRVMEDGK